MKNVIIKSSVESHQDHTITFCNTSPFVLIAGPCVLEGREHALGIARHLQKVCQDLSIPFVFKASFDKANRTSVHGYRGIDWKEAASIFHEIKSTLGCPVLTDVHHPEQCAQVAEAVDILQIPALLCRQTDLVQAAARTGKTIQVKKGQFLSPEEMLSVVGKIEQCYNQKILLCERGTCFGYHNLINDMRSLPILAASGYPVIFDATHSVQRPGLLGDKSGGERKFVETLARAAVGVGIAGLFIETHPDPDHAPSDGPNMVPLSQVERFLCSLQAIDQVTKKQLYADFSSSTQRLASNVS